MPADFGRPSAASGRPWVARPLAHSGTAGIRAEEADTDRWAVRAASVVGVRHRLGGTGNDDAFGFTASLAGLRLVVADGVGSVEGSAGAASAAVTAALEAPGVVEAVAAADGAVTDGGRGATTIVVAHLAGDGTGSLARIGDSSAWLLRSGGWAELFAPPAGDDGEVPVATRALPAGGAAPEVVDVVVGDDEVLLLATDGVSDPLRDGPSTVAPALAEELARPVSAAALIGIADFSRQGCHDDRTILAVWPLTPRRDEAPGEPGAPEVGG